MTQGKEKITSLKNMRKKQRNQLTAQLLQGLRDLREEKKISYNSNMYKFTVNTSLIN